MRKQSLYWFGLVCCLAVALTFRESVLANTGKTTALFLDIGQGDATLIMTPSGQQIVVDGGPDLSLLTHLGKHMPFLDRTIELVILTHPDSDHLTALPELLRRYRVDNLLMTGISKPLPRYQAILAAAADQGTHVMIANPEQDIDMGDGVVLDILWPPPVLLGQMMRKANDSSIVFKLLYNKHRVLLSGDITEEVEMELIRSGVDLSADIMNAPHHGSRTSSSNDFLLAVEPELAIASAGKDNKFGHPHDDVVARYAELDIPLRTTANEGTIRVELQ